MPAARSISIPQAIWTSTRRSRRCYGAEPTRRLVGHRRPGRQLVSQHGIPTVSIGAGQYEIHTIKAYVDLPEFVSVRLTAWLPGRMATSGRGGLVRGMEGPRLANRCIRTFGCVSSPSMVV